MKILQTYDKICKKDYAPFLLCNITRRYIRSLFITSVLFQISTNHNQFSFNVVQYPIGELFGHQGTTAKMEITPVLVYLTIFGSSVWLVIFCILWAIHSRMEKNYESSEPFVLVRDVGDNSRCSILMEQ